MMAHPTQPNRLASGGLIDRTRTLSFTFDGKTYTGYPGDTLGVRAVRQRRYADRPLVQVSPPARHPDRRLRGAERAGRAARRRPPRAEH